MLGRYGAGYLDWRVQNNKGSGYGYGETGKYQGFSADLAAAICLLVSSLTGLPVSTTHTKTTAIMGVGSAKTRILGELVGS